MQIGQAVTELSLLVSKRRSLSFNHNSGLQPGPSHSCCLRPSSCGFRDGIPHALLVVYFSYYPWSGHSHPTPDIKKAFLSLAVRTSETFSAQHSTDELVGAAAAVLLGSLKVHCYFHTKVFQDEQVLKSCRRRLTLHHSSNLHRSQLRVSTES